MGSRLSVFAGLAAGVLVALGLLAGFILVGPDPGRPRASSSPSASAPATAVATASASSSAVASGSVPAASGSGAGSGTANFHVGEPAPALAVPQVGGGLIDLATLKGKAVWLNFMQTTCEECITEFPLMSGFAARYGEQGLVVIAVDIREEEGAVAAFAQELNATFPLGLDSDGTAQRAWGAYALPIHFWIDRDGIVRDGALGGIGADIMARGVQTIMPGVVVEP
jgi:cytochrome c biogenesis protein CcmG/thiol:disulfide interchange protein DsbE